MHPAILNLLTTLPAEQTQDTGGQYAAPAPATTSASPPSVSSYNPFDSGISKAIESARASMAMTRDQEEKAMRKAILQFGDTVGAVPRQTGFKNNLLTGLKSLGAGVTAYDDAETGYLKENNELARQILDYRNAERQAQERASDRNWQRQHAENQLAETRRYHDLYGSLHGQGAGNGKGHKASPESLNQLNNIFNYANNEIDRLGEGGQRGRLTRIVNNYLPGGEAPLTADQASINALDKTLRGKLFNLWDYRAQAEFNKLPHISVDNPPEVNKAIIEELINITKLQMGINPYEESEETLGAASLNTDNQYSAPHTPAQNNNTLRMRTPEGKIVFIPASELQDALKDELVLEM